MQPDLKVRFTHREEGFIRSQWAAMGETGHVVASSMGSCSLSLQRGAAVGAAGEGQVGEELVAEGRPPCPWTLGVGVELGKHQGQAWRPWLSRAHTPNTPSGLPAACVLTRRVFMSPAGNVPVWSQQFFHSCRSWRLFTLSLSAEGVTPGDVVSQRDIGQQGEFGHLVTQNAATPMNHHTRLCTGEAQPAACKVPFRM